MTNEEEDPLWMQRFYWKLDNHEGPLAMNITMTFPEPRECRLQVKSLHVTDGTGVYRIGWLQREDGRRIAAISSGGAATPYVYASDVPPEGTWAVVTDGYPIGGTKRWDETLQGNVTFTIIVLSAAEHNDKPGLSLMVECDGDFGILDVRQGTEVSLFSTARLQGGVRFGVPNMGTYPAHSTMHYVQDAAVTGHLSTPGEFYLIEPVLGDKTGWLTADLKAPGLDVPIEWESGHTNELTLPLRAGAFSFNVSERAVAGEAPDFLAGVIYTTPDAIDFHAGLTDSPPVEWIHP